MARRTVLGAAAVALGVTVGLSGSAAAFGLPVPDPGPRISDPVSYMAGETLVFASAHRNPSCSISRNYRNGADGPVRVLSSVIWDGSLTHTKPVPGTSALDGDDVLQPGGQGTIVFDNVPADVPGMFLLISVIRLPESPLDVGANWMEAVLPCGTTAPPAPPVPVVTAPPVPPVPPPSVPVVTVVPVPSTVVVPGAPPHAEPAPPPGDTFGLADPTGVLTSSTARSLPATGAGDWLGVAALVCVAAVVTGATLVAAAKKDGGR